jgi:hypothetical protein
MKKSFVLFLLGVFLLAACATQQQAPATATATDIVYATPDASMAKFAVGFAYVRKSEGTPALLLRSLPDSASPVSGRAIPGENGKLLGINDSGSWVLLQFKDQSGWAPVDAVDLTISQ